VPSLKEAPAATARSRPCSHPTAQSSSNIADKLLAKATPAPMRTEPTEARKPPSLSPAALVFSSPRRARPYRAWAWSRACVRGEERRAEEARSAWPGTLMEATSASVCSSPEARALRELPRRRAHTPALQQLEQPPTWKKPSIYLTKCLQGRLLSEHMSCSRPCLLNAQKSTMTKPTVTVPSLLPLYRQSTD
jgi:hypothetical protein